MVKVLIVATSRKTRGGITSVIKAHETGEQWKKYHCHWIQTHRDGPSWRKKWYLFRALLSFCVLLPFYDIVHIHSAGYVSAKRKLLFATIAKKSGKKLIVHFHPSGPDAVFDEESRKNVKALFEKADKILVLSPQWKRWIDEAFPSNHYDKEVLWNPCPIVKRDETKRSNNILFAGSIIKRKGYDVLLNAFSLIASIYPDWSIVFVGNGEIEEGKEIAKKLGIINQTRWLGWVSGKNKEEVFQSASIYCLASSGEGFPMGLLDAWAYGVPCVVTPVGGIPDIIKDGINGLLFPIGDYRVLSEKIETLIKDDSLKKRIVAESDKWVGGDFYINNVCTHLEKIYSNLR